MDITGKNVQSAEDLLSSAPAHRTLYVYKIPPSLATVAGEVVEIGIVEINPDEELMATKRCAREPIRLAFELSKEALRAVGLRRVGQDGKPTIVRHKLSTGDGSVDRVWAQLHPKLRALVVTAYNETHNPRDADTNSFLESREVSAG